MGSAIEAGPNALRPDGATLAQRDLVFVKVKMRHCRDGIDSRAVLFGRNINLSHGVMLGRLEAPNAPMPIRRSAESCQTSGY
jgi:hypothetical protein